MQRDGLHYVLSVPAPGAHRLEVTVEIPTAALPDPTAVEVTLPAWCPGSYLIRDYARYVTGLTASAGGAAVPAVKVDKQTWRIAAPAGADRVTVTYAVYGHDLSVRTNHVDDTHAFVHPPATFVHVPALRAAPVTLEVVPPADRTWALATSLDRAPAGDTPFSAPAARYALRAATVDELYDSPLHLGHEVTRHFTVASPDGAAVPVELAVWGPRIDGGAFDLDDLVRDLTAIVEAHAARFGAIPFPHYTYVLMLSHDAYGGLEHRGSSANLHHPRALATRKDYEGLLELLSHELFHAWNGKRIAPPQLLDVDFSREAYTRCLWVMEGLTSHYDRWTLRTAGAITAKSYLEKVLDDWARLQQVPGRHRHSLEASSFDAWIKLYKPDESNLNTTVSYYLKGGLVATALDLEIRRRTEGARSLDDVMRALWRGFGARGVGHPEDVQPIFEEAAGLSLADVFDAQIRGTGDPALAAELAHVGLELRGVADPALTADGATPVWLGAVTAAGTTRLTGVLDGGPGEAAGLSPGDELVAVDGMRATGDAEVRTLLAPRRPGDTVELALFRRHRLHTVRVVLAEAPPTRWEIAGVAEVRPEVAARYQAWIGEAHPGPGVIAQVACATRWI